MSSLLERGFQVLELLAAHPEGKALSSIAAEAGLPLSATHRLLAELARCGYVRQARNQGDYVLTIKLVSLGLGFLSASGVVDVAQPSLDRLAEESRELVRLAIVDGSELVFVAKAQGATRGLRYDPDMGLSVPLSCSAAGHAWLSTMSDEDALARGGPARLRQPGQPRAEGADDGEGAARLRSRRQEARLQRHQRGVRAGDVGDVGAGGLARRGARRRHHRRAAGPADRGADGEPRRAADGHGRRDRRAERGLVAVSPLGLTAAGGAAPDCTKVQ